MFFRLVRTEFKRIKYYGGYMIIAAFILLVLCLLLAGKVSRQLYDTSAREPLSIGIVMSADSSFARMAYATIEDMDSYRTTCHFIEVDSVQSALSMMNNGDLFAAIYVPDNIINDIMDGTNTPVEVYYSDTDSINTFVLNDLFRSTSSMLGISQAAIYSVQSIGKDIGLPDDLQNFLSDDINSMFLTQVLNRSSRFIVTRVNATRTANAVDFYVCASVFLIMTVCGTVFISFVKNVPDSYTDRLRSFHIRTPLRMTGSFASIFVWEYLLYITVYLSLSGISLFSSDIHVQLSAGGFAYGLAVSCLVSAAITAVSYIPAGTHGCSLLLITVFMIAAYLSGFFVPEAMLPNFARNICRSSPLNHMVHSLCNLFGC